MPARRVQPCGTEAAYQRHRYYGEEPCAPCRDAVREAKRIQYRRRNPGAQRRFRLRHGTNACYTAGCRLPACQEAHAEYQNDWYHNGGRSRERVTVVSCAVDVLETYWPDRLSTTELMFRILDIHPEWRESSVRRVMVRDLKEQAVWDGEYWSARSASWEEAS